MESLFGRINRPYEEIKELMLSWADEALAFLVYEHTPDDGCAKTHCHILARSIKPRKRLYERAIWKNLKLEGSKDFGFDKFKEDKNTIPYMTKGIFDPKLVKGYNQDFLDKQKLAWTEPKKESIKAKVERKQATHWQLIELIRERYNEAIKTSSVQHKTTENGKQFTLGVNEHNNIQITQPLCFDTMYHTLIGVLEEKKIRSSTHDLDRWMTTLLRTDLMIGRHIQQSLKKKYMDIV